MPSDEVTTATPPSPSITNSPSRGRKRAHNDENLSPSKNSPSKRHSSGILSIKSFFLPYSASNESTNCNEEQDETTGSPNKKLRIIPPSPSVSTAAPSFITSTPKKTPKFVLPAETSTSTTTTSTTEPAPATERTLLTTLNSLLFPNNKVTKTTSLLDIFSPLRLRSSDSQIPLPVTTPSAETKKEEIAPLPIPATFDEYKEELVASLEEPEEQEEEEEEEEEEAAEEEEEFNPYSFIKILPPAESINHPETALPPKDPNDSRLTLVLDLDETLVHCSTEPIDDPDHEFEVNYNGVDYHVYARTRPLLQHFLKSIANKYEIVVFTASQEMYANKLLDLVDTDRVVHHRLFRDSCVHYEGNFLKDLRVLGRDLSRVVIVDNSPTAYGFQIDNGIPIISWYDHPSDRELPRLLSFLESLHHVTDVRPHVRRKFKTYQLVAGA